jgi:hypothetical protein
MHLIPLLFLLVFFCTALSVGADLSGSSYRSIINVSGCWSGKTFKSPLEDRPAPACVLTELPTQLTIVEISFLDSRHNYGQVSALFKEEGKYAR